MTKLIGLAGLPRSGGTLLANLLAQNPRFHTAGTSGLLQAAEAARESLMTEQIFAAWRSAEPTAADSARRNMLRGAIHGWYDGVDKPVVFDKNPSWPLHIEWLEAALGEPVKIIATVRDMADVLASYERLARRQRALDVPIESRDEPGAWLTQSGRCAQRVLATHPIGYAWAALHDALTRGYRAQILFVRYENLTVIPHHVLDQIYDFIDEEPFEHDVDQVVKVTREDDHWHGYDGMHDIQTRIAPNPSYAAVTLGPDVAADYTAPDLNFWIDLPPRNPA